MKWPKITLLTSLLLTSSMILASVERSKLYLPLSKQMRDIPMMSHYLLAPYFPKLPRVVIKKPASFSIGLKARDKKFDRGKLDKVEQKALQFDYFRWICHLDPKRYKEHRVSYEHSLKRLRFITEQIASFNGKNQATESNGMIKTIDFLLEPDASLAIGLLKSIKKSAPKVSKYRIKILSAALKATEIDTRDEGLKRLRKLVKKHPAKLTIDKNVEHFLLARALGGLNELGEEISRADAPFINHLKKIGQSSKLMPTSLRGPSIAMMTSIWLKGSKKPYRELPFHISSKLSFEDAAIKERQLISEQSPTQTMGAFYQSTFDHYAKTSHGYRIARAILSKEDIKYRQQKDHVAYYDALQILQHDWQDKLTSHPRNQEVLTQIKRKQRSIAIKGLKHAQDSDDLAYIRSILRMAKQVIGANERLTKVRSLMEMIANLHAKLNQHNSAAKIMADIIGQTKSIGPLLKLARFQKKAANWPNSPPFDSTPKSRLSARKRLLKTYLTIKEQLEIEHKDPDWQLISQIGLIQLSLGKTDETTQLWIEQLKKGGHQVLRAKASGKLIHILQQEEKWNDANQLISLVIRLDITPIHGKSPVQLRQIWLDTNYHLALNQYQDEKAKNTIQHMKNFVAAGSKDPRRPKILKMLALSYIKRQEPRLALDLILNFLKEKPQRELQEPFLSWGHQLAVDHGFDEEATAFGLNYLDAFPKSSKRVMIRNQLINIMAKRGVDSQVASISVDQARDEGVPKRERLRAAAMVIRLGEKHSKGESLIEMAEVLLKLAPDHQKLVSLAVLQLAKDAETNQDRDKLKDLLKKLDHLPPMSQPIALARGQIILSLANLSVPKHIELGKRAPQEILKYLASVHNAVSKEYEKACVGIIKPFCGPAKYQKALFSERIVATIDQIILPSDMNQQAIYQFDHLREKLMKHIQKLTHESLQKAQSIMKETEIDSMWRQKIEAGSAMYSRTGYLAE